MSIAETAYELWGNRNDKLFSYKRILLHNIVIRNILHRNLENHVNKRILSMD